MSKYKVLQNFAINDKTYYHDFLVVEDMNLLGVHVLLRFDLIKKLRMSIHVENPPK